MPCYLKYVPVNVEIKTKNKNKIPSKAEAKASLTEALKNGLITPAKYQQLIQKVDACVEVKGHTHEHEHIHLGVN